MLTPMTILGLSVYVCFLCRCQINEVQKNRERKPKRRTKRMSHDEGQQVNVDEETREADMPRSPQVEVKAMVDYDQMNGTVRQEGTSLQRFLSRRNNDLVVQKCFSQMQYLC